MEPFTHMHSRQSTKFSLQSSELGPPPPPHPHASVSAHPFGSGGGTRLREMGVGGGGGPNSDKGTETVFTLCLYPSTFSLTYGGFRSMTK